MAIDNSHLATARKIKNDEFYTQLADIENELRHYRHHFKDKHIFCNCDDPEWSNFWRYFALNFHHFGLKQLTSTHYDEGAQTYRMDMFKDVPDDFKNKETFMTLEETGIELPLGYITPLTGDGDFRSQESIEILKECDIVVTNPPFSLFRTYVEQLDNFDKNYIIIGNKNIITYKEIFPLIKNNKMWVGVKTMSGSLWFETPEGYVSKNDKIVDGKKLTPIACCWYTNLDHSKRHEELILYKKYNEVDYPKYDNYDAIEVGKTADIPMDYDGYMGVPITFMDKYNPDQFEIFGATESEGKGFSNGLWDESSGVAQPLIGGKRKYKRLFIKRK